MISCDYPGRLVSPQRLPPEGKLEMSPEIDRGPELLPAAPRPLKTLKNAALQLHPLSSTIRALGQAIIGDPAFAIIAVAAFIGWRLA
jgi:hypothetical protein